MRRQILRFPVGQQFRKILEDDHEWIIITDTRLKILLAERGDINTVPKETMKETYLKLARQYLNNHYKKPLKIYTLHTHPHSHKAYLSTGDWNFSIALTQKKLLREVGIHESGYGVIGLKEIVIVTLPEDKQRLEQLDKKFADNLEGKEWMYHFKKRYDPVVAKKRNNASKKLEKDPAYESALKTSLLENPDIKTKTLRRTHRFNMGRRR